MRSENRAAFSQRVIQDLKRRSSLGLFFYITIPLIVVFANDFYKRQPNFSILFTISLSVVCLFRFAHLFFSERLRKRHRALNEAFFFISVSATSIVWGFCFAYFMTLEQEYEAKLLIAICTAGLSAGGNIAFVPNLRLAIFYSFWMLAPTILLMLVKQTNLPLTIFILFHLIYLVLLAKRAHREYWQAIENEQLLIKKSEQLKLLSSIDGLTGLYNRRHFDERMDQEWKKTSRVQQSPTVIICDIDFFKKINDQHGHQAGDEFLKLTASLLKTVFKRDTDIVARFGGEEFIVLLTDNTPEEAFAMAQEMRQRMSSMLMPYKGENISTTLSIGVASSNPEDRESRDSLIARADKALYRAKREGRNRTVVAPSKRPLLRECI